MIKTSQNTLTLIFGLSEKALLKDSPYATQFRGIL